MTSPDRTDELIRAMLALGARAGNRRPTSSVARCWRSRRHHGARVQTIGRSRLGPAGGSAVARSRARRGDPGARRRRARSWTARRGAGRRQRSRDGGRSHGGAIDHAGRLGGRGEPGSVGGNAALHG